MARSVMFKFGLLAFPAKLDKATETKPRMSNMCTGQPGQEPHDPLPVRQPYTCTTCGPVTDTTALSKGVKQGNTYTIVSQDDVAEAKESYAKDYKGVLDFVPHPSADVLAQTAPGASLNYLVPADATGEGHYQLMLKLVQEHPELAFVCLHTPVSATNLYMLSVRDNVLVVEQRTRSESLRPAPSVGGEVNEQLYAMLDAQIEAFVTPFSADAYEDRFATALAQMVADGEQVTIGAAEPAQVVVPSDDELMAKLTALAGGKKAPRKRAAKKGAPKEAVA